MAALGYACIAEKDNSQESFVRIVQEYGPFTTQLYETIRLIIPRVSVEPHKRTLTQNEFNFHYKVSGNNLYLCVAKPEFPLRVAYAFIDEIEKEYLRRPNNSRILKELMKYYSDLKNDKISTINEKINDAKTTMVDNIEKILHRGESLHDLMIRSDELNDSAGDFTRGTNQVKWSMRKRMAIIIAIIVILMLLVFGVVFVIVWIACGTKFQKCSPPSPSTPAPTTL
jgi:vesicle-associated membrane protein 7